MGAAFFSNVTQNVPVPLHILKCTHKCDKQFSVADDSFFIIRFAWLHQLRKKKKKMHDFSTFCNFYGFLVFFCALISIKL